MPKAKPWMWGILDRDILNPVELVSYPYLDTDEGVQVVVCRLKPGNPINLVTIRLAELEVIDPETHPFSLRSKWYYAPGEDDVWVYCDELPVGHPRHRAILSFNHEPINGHA